ncbi:hypothetical protein U1Q18_005316 [Sarracenia purpurea var. burkii]
MTRQWSGAGVGAALVAEQRSGACGGVERRSIACGSVEQVERPWWRSGGAALAAVVEQAERRDGSAGVRRGAWWRDAVVRAGISKGLERPQATTRVVIAWLERLAGLTAGRCRCGARGRNVRYRRRRAGEQRCGGDH